MHSEPVENEGTPLEEDFAQILKRLRDTYGGITDSEVARRIGLSVSAVNTWSNRKRTPKADAIRALAAAFPKFSEAELFAAAGRRAPGPLNPDAEQRILELYRGLTAEQQQAKEVEMRALNEMNRA